MRVLQLVTTPRPFFDSQVRILEKRGMDITTVQVPGNKNQRLTRSVSDYLRFYPSVLRHSFQQYDIIHANYGLTGPFALAQPRRPVVLSLWGSDLMGKYSKVSSHCASLFNEVILPSPVMSSQLDCGHTVIPFGVDTNLFKPINQSLAREKLGWDQSKNIVLFPYSPSRDVKQFDLAKKIVNSSNKDVQLRSISSVPHEKMPLYMNASDVVLVTSKRESGPMVVKEAAVCNVPVVSTNVGFVNNVLSDVSYSYVCDSQEQLVEGLQTVLNNRRRSNGRSKLIDEVGLDRMGKQIERVYKRLL